MSSKKPSSPDAKVADNKSPKGDAIVQDPKAKAGFSFHKLFLTFSKETQNKMLHLRNQLERMPKVARLTDPLNPLRKTLKVVKIIRLPQERENLGTMLEHF